MAKERGWSICQDRTKREQKISLRLVKDPWVSAETRPNRRRGLLAQATAAVT